MGRILVSIDTKNQIIGMWKTGKVPKAEIGRKLSISDNCVGNTIKFYQKNGHVLSYIGCGRQPKTTIRNDSWLYKQCRQDPNKSYRDLAADFNNCNFGVTINKDTCRKILLRRGLESHLAVQKPLLTVRNRLKRRNWCKQRLHWSVEDWSRVIFSDEANYEVFNRKSAIYVKRLKSDMYASRYAKPRIQGGQGSVGIWGCISYHGTGVSQCYQGRIDQYKYQEVLDNCLFPSVDLMYDQDSAWQFVQDGAPAHTAGSTKA